MTSGFGGAGDAGGSAESDAGDGGDGAVGHGATGGARAATGGTSATGTTGGRGHGGTPHGTGGEATAARGGDAAGGDTAAGAASITAGEGGAGPSCDFKVSWSISDAIPTVAIVEWTTSTKPDDASIEFGLDTSYGMTAPVDLSAPGYRTVLLGMKPSHAYHFRIVSHAAGRTCMSDDSTLATGPSPNGLPAVSITDHGGRHFSGFLLSGFMNTGPVFMLDADGDYVWSYGDVGSGRAALTHDGKFVWFAAINVAGDAASMKRVTVDGLEETDFTAEFGNLHHDFTLLPDDTIAYLVHDGDSDLVLERAPDGTVTQVLDVAAALGTTRTHANSIHYYPADDSYTLSELTQDSIIKFGRDGHVEWILGGTHSDFTGDVTWDGQHGHELVGSDELWFFTNGITTNVSAAWELKLDLSAHTATRVWQYEPGLHCLIYGDVAPLTGETLVAFSALGVIHELDSGGELVRELDWPIGGAIGYTTVLPKLYPPFE